MTETLKDKQRYMESEVRWREWEPKTNLFGKPQKVLHFLNQLTNVEAIPAPCIKIGGYYGNIVYYLHWEDIVYNESLITK